MTTNQLLHIIKQEENETLEFKTSFNRTVIETIVAFSNAKGGNVVLGVNDDKKIVGISISNESIQKWINEIKQNTEPSILPTFESIKIDNKLVVIIAVDEFPLKPVSYKNKFYVRKNNSNHRLSVNDIVKMRFISLNYSFDSFEINTKYDDLNIEALDFFKKRISKAGRYKPTSNLINDFEKLGFIKKDRKLTRAAELLFGNHHTTIHIGRFKSQTVIIDDIVIRSPLILAVDEALDFIKRNIALGYEFGGDGLKRKDRWQYPIPAIRELLLNAIVHRDYTNPTDVIIKIYDDKIEISNPGRLMGGLTVEDFKTDNYQSKHRNKLLAEAFYLTGDIEKYGTGFKRLREWLVESPNLDLNIHDLGDFIRVEIFTRQSKIKDNVVDNVVDKRLEFIIEIILKNNQLSAVQIAKKLDVSSRTVQRDLDKLKQEGKLKRIGSEKSGYWKII
jgi:ATP-dependent DNA helicase RecG